jgi:hypothetical protein
MSTWHEITVTGKEVALRAFLAGFEAARMTGALLGTDLEIEPRSLPARIRKLLAGGDHHHVFLPVPLGEELVGALAEHGPRVELSLIARAEVIAAEFSFQAEVFSEELASGFKLATLAGLPEGVSVTDLAEHEENLPGDGVPGPYDPAHDYEYRVSGRVHGPFPGVLEMRRRTRQHEFVTTGPVRLALRELPLR